MKFQLKIVLEWISLLANAKWCTQSNWGQK